MMRRSTSLRQPHRPWVVWLALWLTLFAALAPSVSYALQAAANRDAVDLHAVCSAAFMGTAPSAAPTAPVWSHSDAPPSDPSPAPTSAAAGGHCALCLLSIERLTTPPSSVVGVAVQPASYALPAAPPPQRVQSFLELNPPPRGPPALS